MSDQRELVRLESAVSATASGNLTWEQWPLDCAVALGLSGQRNPLGFAVVRYLSDAPSAMNTWNLVLTLAAELERRKIETDDIKEAAMKAFEFWRDSRCPSCGGRGMHAKTGVQCPPCGGSGRRVVPEHPAYLSAGVAALDEAETWMDRQLSARLKNSSHRSHTTAKLSLPSGRLMKDDIDGLPQTSPVIYD